MSRRIPLWILIACVLLSALTACDRGSTDQDTTGSTVTASDTAPEKVVQPEVSEPGEETITQADESESGTEMDGAPSGVQSDPVGTDAENDRISAETDDGKPSAELEDIPD